MLESYHWPGNIRELENLIHRAVLFTDGLAISPKAICLDSGAQVSNQPAASATQESFATAKTRAIEAFERGYLITLLRSTGGNVSEAARRAEKERRAFRKLLKKYAIVSDQRIGNPSRSEGLAQR